MDSIISSVATLLSAESPLWNLCFFLVTSTGNTTSPLGILLATVVATRPAWLSTLWSSLASGSSLHLVGLVVPGCILATYWIHGGALLILDITRWQPLYRYKLQPNTPLDLHRVPRLLMTVVKVQLMVFVPLHLVIWWITDTKLWGMGLIVQTELPSPRALVFHMVGFVLVDEILFYWTHRMAHHRSLYKLVHKVHHEWTAPVALAADYCHPLEHLVVNVPPMAAYGVIAGADAFSYLIWWMVAYLSSQTNHSGYRFPPADWVGEAQPDFHDLHHQKFNCNYGSLRVLDWLHGTIRLGRSKQNDEKNK